tara:strand:- start:819 stop:2012 length:1194 start_codon:yes stop_codon:yes gene_type:complete
MKKLRIFTKNYYRKILNIIIDKLRKNKLIRLIRNFYYLIINIRIKGLLENKQTDTKVNFVFEKADWAIRWDAIYISNSLNKNYKNNIVKISSIPLINSNKKVIHFASQYMWLDWEKLMPKRNKYIVSFFHGKPEDSHEVKKHIDDFIKTQNKIYKIITAASLIKNRLISWGINKDKIVLIHTGVDTKLFTIPSRTRRHIIRKRLNFNDNDIIIGSFQKDGVGWGDGNLPKMIKGPDIFVKTVELISKKYPIKILLTGPSRGYVKNELRKREIKYKHIFLDNYEEINNYYHALDLYIVASREEGGPKSMLESMASGVPIVTTNVGMASEFITDKVNGGIINSFKPSDLAKKSLEILNLPKEDLIKKARKSVLKADWDIVAKLHWDYAYKTALDELNQS